MSMEPSRDLDHVLFSVDYREYDFGGRDKITDVASWMSEHGVSTVSVDVRGRSLAERELKVSGVSCRVGLKGGREEVLKAVRSTAEAVAEGEITASEVDSRELEERLPDISDVDLVVSTMENRLVDSSLWGTVYSELRFVDSWSELARDDIESLVEDFAGTERRYGR